MSTRVVIALLLLVALAACGGGSGSPAAIVPEAQAEPVSACPSGDATAQLQAMIDSAKGALQLPACVFQTSAPLVIGKPLRLTGSSATVDGTIIRSTADEAVVIDPAVRISVALGPTKRGWWGSVENLRIECAAGGAGKHGLVIRTRTGFFVNNWLVDRIYAGGCREHGLLLENAAGNADGIFTGVVRNSFIESIKGINLGDSVHFIDNVVPNGVNRASTDQLLPGFDLSFVPGAAESTLIRNNITAGGGCVLVRSGQGVGVLNNWCESATAGEGQGLIHLAHCAECTVRDNRVQTLGGSAAYALALDASTLTVIDSNKLTSGTAGHIGLLNGSTQNKLAGLNRFLGSGDPTAGKITGAATGLLTTP